ncbi:MULTISPECIES: GDP-L-fucose synthase [unclassified Achromobacter]|uniref:GDP-L-fucose synthase n=1 Tax=unclassified Achromobacter TaxID=2626865 RepID=UPI000B51C43F|nr:MULTISPECIES: GDP-L-fucose synthase [unclassified Achromobacter]OWT68974.1 GDP-fucose synthetase [Achromobacter sp. HZ28]OWT78463.1 GDP-fucose synthetase [Achromobacter sp. HZ34]
MADLEQRIYVAGHRGMVGSAIVRELRRQGYRHIITRQRDELDLENQNQVNRFFCTEKVDVVYLAAAKVGGILANDTYPVDFLYRNLMIQDNIIHAAHAAGVRRLLFLGSSCIYPKLAPQPIREDALLTGPLEPTNEAYAIAKIAGLKLCEAYNRQYGTQYVCAMPTNLYGENDNYDLRNSHVLPALIRKFHEAREAGAPYVTLWGSGQPRREFLYVDDLARACLRLMQVEGAEGLYNVGVGEDLTIAELAALVAQVVGYEGELTYDSSKPDGTPRKLLDVSRMQALGWRADVSLRQGIQMTYRHYLRQVAEQPLPLA